jgi:nucleoside-diphosphate-sugar epimerase
MRKRILVTGGLGFIGYHLCRRLVEEEPDSEIVIIDNLSSTRLDYSPLQKRARILIQDFCSLTEEIGRFDEIYHLASPVGSLGILEKNGYIAKEILDLALTAGHLAARSGARLLYISSSEVYGRDGRHQETAEQIVPCKRGTRMEYALAKLTAEHVLLNLAADNAFELRIIRPFNVVGEWQSSAIGFVVPKFFEAALTGEPLHIYGTGRQIRSFCHVDDLVNGIISVQARGRPENIYNIGHPDNIINIADLAIMIRTLSHSGSPIHYVDPVSLYGKHYIEAFDKVPNVDKALVDTGWKPNISLSAALERVVTYYRTVKYPKITTFANHPGIDWPQAGSEIGMEQNEPLIQPV